MASNLFLKFDKVTNLQQRANNACTRLGVRTAFFSIFLAYAESRFEGESTLPPQAGNANR
jgi:hypothetical protein